MLSLFKTSPHLSAFAVLVLLILLPYWKLVTMQGFLITNDIFTSDIMNEGFPYRFSLSEALKNGEAPTWLPHIYGGIPLLARAEAGVCSPFNIILFGLLPPYTALNMVILLTLITAAIGACMYARLIGAGLPGALVAGIAFAYSGFMVSHIKHLSMVGTVCWFPFGLYFIEQAFRNTGRPARYLLAFATVFALQHLSGHTQTAYYSGLVYVVYVLFRFLHEYRSTARVRGKRGSTGETPATWWRRPVLAWFVIALVLATGMSAVQLLPTYELVSLTQRAGGVSFDYAANYAYDVSNFKTFFHPYANGDISDATYRGSSIFWEDYGYVGILTLLLAVYAVVKARKNWHVRFFAITAVASYIMVLGPNTPVYELAFNIVPGMSFFRFPTRFLFVVNASLAILAATGLTHLLLSFKSRGRVSAQSETPVAGLVIVGLVAADLLYVQLRQNPLVDADAWLKPPQTVELLKNGKDDGDLFRIYSIGASDVHKMVFAAARGWSGSLQPYIDHREFLQVSSNVLYGIYSADGYAQLTPRYVVDVWGDQNRPGFIRNTANLQGGEFIPSPSFFTLMKMYNVRYLLSAWPIRSNLLEDVGRHGSVHLYKLTDELPRAHLVGSYRVVAGAEAARDFFLAGGFNPEREAILYEEPGFSGSSLTSNSTARVEDYRTNEVIVQVSAEAEALLVLSDTYYPGWRAEIDGRSVPILQANFSQRAVVVPAGEHAVRLVFDSVPVKIGLGITAVSMILVALGVVFLIKKER